MQLLPALVGHLRQISAFVLAPLLVLGIIALPASPAESQPTGSEIEITDVRFQNDEFKDGSRQKIDVDWTIPGKATNPVVIEVDLPEKLRGYDDNFSMIGPDGEPAGICEVRATKITCTADEDFINDNPAEVSGSFTFSAHTTFDNKETITESFDIGGFSNEVTIGPNPNWCLENCEFGGQGAGKWGSYNNLTDEIVWTVQIPAPEQGIEAGKTITVTDVLDEQDYEVIKGNTYPRVLEGGSISYNKWDREGVDYNVRSEGVEWSDDLQEVTFDSRAGKGQDADLGEKKRGTDGSFYQVQWHVAVNTPGDLQPNGDRVFKNGAKYSIDGSDPSSTNGSSTRYSGSGTIVGRNFGKFQVTKELSGDTTLDPEFIVEYTYTEPGQEPKDGKGKIRAGGTFTSPEFYRGTVVTINEVTPTDPANVTWSDPVFVDENDNPVTKLEFTAGNKNLGKITKLRLQNKATLNTGDFSAKKTITNDDGVPLPDDLTFTLDYTYPADAAKGFPAGQGSLTLPANGETVTSSQLPVGAELTLSEAKPKSIPGATWAEPKLSTSKLTIGEGSTAGLVTVSNTITQDLGGFAVTKDVTGTGEDLVPEGTDFTVKYSYTAVNGFPAGDGQVNVKAGESSEAVKNIPVGAVVTLDEVAPVDPVGGTWGEPKFDVSEFTVAKDTIVSISLDNPISWNDGDFSAKKVVDGDGADLVADDVAFTIDYSYELPEGLDADERTGSGTLTVLNDGQAVTSDRLPYGTKVALSEATPGAVPGGTWTGSSFDNESFAIGDETTLEVVLTNTIERDLGAFSLAKTISGNGEHTVPEGTEFTIDYSYPAGPGFEAGEGTATVVAGEDPVVVEEIPAQAVVTLTERAPEHPEGGTWADAKFEPGKVITIGKDKTTAVVIDNPIELNSGVFSVAKDIAGDGADLVGDDAEFTVDYTYPAGDGFEAGSGSLTVKADGAPVTSDPLPFGAEVSLSEAEPKPVDGGTWTGFDFSQDGLTIGDNTTVAVQLTNTIERDLGAFSLAKTISGNGEHTVPEGTEFTIDYSYPAGPGFEAGEGTATVVAGEDPVVIDEVPAGAEVTLTEKTPTDVEGGSWSEAVFDPGATFTVEKNETTAIVVTNPIDLNTGDFSIEKSLDGDAADLVDEDTVFTVDYTYPAGDGFDAGSGSLEVKADGKPVASDQLPYGAVVTLTEQAPETIADAHWSEPVFSQDTLTIGDGTTIEVDLTNTITEEPPAPGSDSDAGSDAGATADGNADGGNNGASDVGTTANGDADGSNDGGGHLPRTGMGLGALIAGLLLVTAGSLTVVAVRRKRS